MRDTVSVLWVEPTPLIAVYGGLMEALGVERFHAVRTRRQGLDLARTEAFDLILVGASLDDGEGLDLVVSIRALPSVDPRTRILLVSSLPCTGDHRLWAVDGILRPPVTARALRDTLVLQ